MQNDFGRFLKEKRLEKNLTQKQLADLLFVSVSTVSKWETDVAHPDISLLPKLCESLEVTEHELITASVDKQREKEKVQAKRWRLLSRSWVLFFYISYAVALIPCFICNLAIDKTLSWFWIVLCALLLSFTFTNLPKLIKNHKLIFLPLSSFLSLCLLLGVCCIYTNGSWFFVATLSVLFGLIVIFTPIYIAKYNVFSKIKKYNDFISIAVDFIALNLLLIVIYWYTRDNGYASSPWYLTIALPVVLCVYLILNLFLCVRFLKVNKLIKTSAVLFLFDLLYLVTPLVKIKDLAAQEEINDFNIFLADFSKWKSGVNLENNIHCLIFLTALIVAVIFFVFGFILHAKRKK